jgi:hypothetical protein
MIPQHNSTALNGKLKTSANPNAPKHAATNQITPSSISAIGLHVLTPMPIKSKMIT